MKRDLLTGFFSAIVGGLIVVACLHFIGSDKQNSSALQIKVESSPVARGTNAIASFAPVVKKAAASVVNIYSTQIIHVRQFWSPFAGNPFFQQFFGDQLFDSGHELTRKEQSLGSGIIVSPDGYILTANHVVAGAAEIRVSVDGKKEYTAKVVGTDPPTDVAVLKIDATNLPAITLADSSRLEVGDVVIAIGNPYGLGQTVTMGIVSATGRGGLGINGPEGYENFIQTDAAINPGNSGGALVDAEGRLVGINTAIIGKQSEGIGFAVPVNLARNVMERLISSGSVVRGYLGVMEQNITPGLADAFHLSDQNGALVGGVIPGTPAAKAGIQPGDVITEFNGEKVGDANDLRVFAAQTAPGNSVAVQLMRDGREKTFQVTLAELPGSKSIRAARADNDSNPPVKTTIDALDGVTVMDLDDDTRQQLKIPDDIQGALVSDVDPDSNAADAGLEQGDVIISINRQPVHNAEAAVELGRRAGGKRILLWVWHHDEDFSGTHYLSVDNLRQK